MPIFPIRRRGRHHGRATFPTPRPRRRPRLRTVLALVALAAVVTLAAVSCFVIGYASAVAEVTR